MIKNFLLLSAAIVLLSCCKKERSDTIPPVIGNIILNGVEIDPEADAGDTLFAYVKVADNELLRSAKVEIHGGGGHTHRVTATFDYLNIIPLSGALEEINLAIPIPADTEVGEYHFTVQAIDAAGNESELRVTDFHIH